MTSRKLQKKSLKKTLQYQPDDRPTMKQVMEQLSQLKEQIVRVGDFQIIANEKHVQWEYEYGELYGRVYETAYVGEHVAKQQPVTAIRYTTEARNQVRVAMLENGYHLIQSVVTPHDNIAKLYHSSKKEYKKDGKEIVEIWIITEHCQCDLWDYTKEEELTVKQKLSLMIQTGRAIRHLHEQQPVNVVHRNTNPLELLVSGSPHAPVIKLAHFDSATTVDKDDFPFPMQSNVGCVYTKAPEQTQQGDARFTQLMCDISVDVFGLGVSCLMLLEALKGSGMTCPEGEYNMSLLYI